MTTLKALTALRDAVRRWPAERFDYRRPGHENAAAGCVLLVRVSSLSKDASRVWFDTVPENERHFIAGYQNDHEVNPFDPLPGKQCFLMTDDEALGENGKAEAIRRIELIMSRYGG
jgi:hypothetical protein